MSNQPQQQQQSPIYLFISKDCQNSMKLIEEIKKKPEIAKNIQAVPIETAPKLPPNLSHVPTLMIEGNLLVGKQCFSWIESQGELDAGPVIGAKGFETSSYSFLGNDESSQGGNPSESFSFIGQRNGSEGVNGKAVDENINAEAQNTRSMRGGASSDFEKFQQQRDSDTSSIMQQQPRQI